MAMTEAQENAAKILDQILGTHAICISCQEWLSTYSDSILRFNSGMIHIECWLSQNWKNTHKDMLQWLKRVIQLGYGNDAAKRKYG
jgi:hypothetical protein